MTFALVCEERDVFFVSQQEGSRKEGGKAGRGRRETKAQRCRGGVAACEMSGHMVRARAACVCVYCFVSGLVQAALGCTFALLRRLTRREVAQDMDEVPMAQERPAQDDHAITPVTPSPGFDLDSYISNYAGRCGARVPTRALPPCERASPAAGRRHLGAADCARCMLTQDEGAASQVHSGARARPAARCPACPRAAGQVRAEPRAVQGGARSGRRQAGQCL